MKNNFLFLAGISVFMFVACEDDDHDHDSNCQECHISFMEDDVSEHAHDIGEFCGDDLADVEANGFTVDVAFDHDGVTYEVGHQFEASVVHCEEHGSHDDHNH